MQLSLKSNIREVIGFLGELSDQAPFAITKALSDTAIEVQRALPDEAGRAFEGGATRYTRQGFGYTRATKQRLVASVFIRPQQAEYLRFQVDGGLRQPRRVALRLPSVVHLDPYGNVPAGLIRQLVARAQAGKRATKTQARRFGVSQALDLFYGDPGDGRPAGIYKRVVHSATSHSLVPIIVFPKRAARYADRPFDFYGFAERIARRSFSRHLDLSWRQALSTAR